MSPDISRGGEQIHDEGIARPWSKYSSGSSAHARLNPGAASTSPLDSGVVSTETHDRVAEDGQVQPRQGHRKIMSALEATKKDPKLRGTRSQDDAVAIHAAHLLLQNSSRR